MNRSAFVYVTYIRSPRERVWEALTVPSLIKRYWFGMDVESDFRAGASWTLQFEDGRVADHGEILIAEPPEKLVIRWLNDWRPELAAEGPARCTFTLETAGETTKLTVLHEIERADSKLIEAVSGGWPKILSNLKSLLETGEVAMKHKA
jgi:uncharacterized protein YndB with AHSA1/START domain